MSKTLLFQMLLNNGDTCGSWKFHMNSNISCGDRCVNGFIPCSWSLFQRYVADTPCYFRCLVANEMPLDAIWRCPQSIAVLKMASFSTLS